MKQAIFWFCWRLFLRDWLMAKIDKLGRRLWGATWGLDYAHDVTQEIERHLKANRKNWKEAKNHAHLARTIEKVVTKKAKEQKS